MVGLAEPEAADLLARRELGKPLLLVLVASEGINRIHHQGALDRSKRPNTGISRARAPGQMRPYAMLLRPAQPYSSGRFAPSMPISPNSGMSLLRKTPLDIRLAYERHHALLDPLAHRVPDHALLFTQERVDVVEVRSPGIYRPCVCLLRGCVPGMFEEPGFRREESKYIDTASGMGDRVPTRRALLVWLPRPAASPRMRATA